MNTTTKIVLGMATAAVAGAAIGMLLAPEKGSDLQKKIKEGATDWLKEFKSLISTGKEVINEIQSSSNKDAERELGNMRTELSSLTNFETRKQ